MKKLTIAIDGYASCGKSTVAKDVARHLNLLYIDSGAMYRAVTLFALRKKLIEDNNIKTSELIAILPKIHIEFEYNNAGELHTLLNGKNIEAEIRDKAVSALVSPVAKIKEVREYLVKQQKAMRKNTGIVMDGRDIGTVVFPDADLKIFMTAEVEVRAIRRLKEMQGKGIEVTLEEIKQNIADRDYRDENRDITPLRKAPDAVVLDNSYMTREEQLEFVLRHLPQNQD